MITPPIMSPQLRDLGFVPRWSIVRTIKHQSVAEHSFFVAAIVVDMIKWFERRLSPWSIGQLERTEMLKLALFHDLSESVTGDITGPIKGKIVNKSHYESVVEAAETRVLGHGIDTFAELVSEEGVFLVKVADFLESLLFIGDEIKLGNRLEDLYSSLKDTLYRRVNGSGLDSDFVHETKMYIASTLELNRHSSPINTYEDKS